MGRDVDVFDAWHRKKTRNAPTFVRRIAGRLEDARVSAVQRRGRTAAASLETHACERGRAGSQRFRKPSAMPARLCQTKRPIAAPQKGAQPYERMPRSAVRGAQCSMRIVTPQGRELESRRLAASRCDVLIHPSFASSWRLPVYDTLAGCLQPRCEFVSIAL